MMDIIFRKAEMSDMKQLISMRIAYLCEDLGEELSMDDSLGDELKAFFS